MAAPVRIGLIGAGRWGQVYLKTLPELADRCRLTHLCTSRPEHAALAPRGVTVVPEWRGLVLAGCDAVIIATPPSTHAEILEGCVSAGTPCIVEKPLCLDVATAERLHQAVQSSGVPVLVDHTHLFSAAYRTLVQTLCDAGEPVRVVISEGMGFGPFRTHTTALWDWAPHDVSLCLDLAGAAPRQLDVLEGPRGPDGEPELVAIRLDFPGNACAWIHAGRLGVQKRRHLGVITDTRVYAWDALASDALSVSSAAFAHRYRDGIPEGLERRTLAVPASAAPMARLLGDFLDGLAGGDRSRFGLGLAVEVTKVLAACEQVMAKRRSASAHAIS